MPSFLFEGNPIDIENGDSVLDAILRTGTHVEHGCKFGACQSCLLKANTKVSSCAQSGLDLSTVALGGFLSCQATPTPDLEVERFDPAMFPVYEGSVIEHEFLSEDVCKLVLKVPGLDFCPGRFIQLSHPRGVRRPYSVATSALGDRTVVELHVRILQGGRMSRLVSETEVGDKFQIQGPFGRCCYNAETTQKDILLIGSGTGLAPLLAIASDALSQGHTGDIWLYHGSATAEGLYMDSELRQIDAQYQNFHYCGCVDVLDCGDVFVGSPLDAALNHLGSLQGKSVFLCGHPGLVRAAQKRCFLAGASMRDIHADPFEVTA